MPMPNMMTPQAPQYPGFPGLAPGAVQGLQFANQLADYNRLMQQASQAQQMGLGEYGLDIEQKMLNRPLHEAERQNKMGAMQWETEQRNALRRDPRVLPAMVESKIAESAKAAIENNKATAETLAREAETRGRMLDPIVQAMNKPDKAAGLAEASAMYEELRKTTPGLPEFNPGWIRTNHAGSQVVLETARRIEEQQIQGNYQLEQQRIATAGGIRQAEIQGQTQRDVEKMRGDARIALEEAKGALSNQLNNLRKRVEARKAAGGPGWTQEEKDTYDSLESMIINLPATRTRAMGETLQPITDQERALQAPNTPKPWANEGKSIPNRTSDFINLQIQNHPKKADILEWQDRLKKANPNATPEEIADATNKKFGLVK